MLQEDMPRFHSSSTDSNWRMRHMSETQDDAIARAESRPHPVTHPTLLELSRDSAKIVMSEVHNEATHAKILVGDLDSTTDHKSFGKIHGIGPTIGMITVTGPVRKGSRKRPQTSRPDEHAGYWEREAV